MKAPIALTTPLAAADLADLAIGDWVRISGVLYTARDAAHERLWQAARRGEALPFDPAGQIVYYVGPTPARPGHVIGAAGPTTASRMDPHTPFLLELGLKAMIGKGRRSEAVRAAMREHRAVYFGAVEGTAALLSRFVTASTLVAYEDLGAEAIRRLAVEDFPAVVVNDVRGNDLYDEGRRRYRRATVG